MEIKGEHLKHFKSLNAFFLTPCVYFVQRACETEITFKDYVTRYINESILTNGFQR